MKSLFANFQIFLLFFIIFLTFGCAFDVRIIDEEDDDSIGACSACPAGTFSNRDHHITNCTEFCPEGFCPKNMTCVPCKPGSFNDQENATSCTICPPGYIADISGSTNCTICPAGTSNNTLNTACNNCPGGYHAPSGSSICFPCGAGSFSPGGSEFCVPCPRGTYSESETTSKCTPCGPGKWNPELGGNSSQACLECPVGYYCPNEDTGNPKICPGEHYCPSGSKSPFKCFPLFESTFGQGNCSPTKWLWIVVGCSGFVLIVILIVVVAARSRKKNDIIQMGSRRKIETQRLIPNEGQTPSYSGL